MQAETVVIETVFYEGHRGWMVEVRLDGHAISSWGPYVDKTDAELWGREIGKQVAEQAKKIKMSLIDSLKNAER